MKLIGMRLSRWVVPLVFALTGWQVGAQELALPHPVYVSLFEQARAYENGEGVARNTQLAAILYCEAARQGDGNAQYNLGWMYANGRGVTRDDALAAYFFHAAAEQGIDAAQRMLKLLGEHTTDIPECMREPEPMPEEPPQVADLPRWTTP